ncbi:hypothetical protein BDF21DRAFT_495214 [Thamnidium elegans]|nr:hypothetical protein BDF21DRAFT_495214 [Thamnidium elegans]
MTRARKESAFHLALLVLVQWISLAVVILNATALFLLRTVQHSGLVTTHSSPADYILLILGSLSFIGSSIFLLMHLQLYFCIIDDIPFTPPRSLSATEVITSVISITLWTVATSVILAHSQEDTSPCQFTSSLYTKNHSDVCELFDTTLMLAFAAVGSWVLVLLVTLFILIRSPIPPTTIFTIEAPPQRFSQPMSVSLPDEIYSQEPATRPYYLGHYANKVRPLTNDNMRATVDKNSSNATSSSGPRTRQTIMMLPNQQDSTKNTRYYCYQPERNLVLSSPSVNNTTTEESSSSYYSSRCQIPQVESQRTLSTLDSIFTGYPPIQFDLPIIQLGVSWSTFESPVSINMNRELVLSQPFTLAKLHS